MNMDASKEREAGGAQRAYPKEDEPAKDQKQKHHAEQNGAQNALQKMRSHPLFMDAAVVLVLVLAIGGYLYFQQLESMVFIENAQITAPIIYISPLAPGTLDKLYVQPGDSVAQGQRLAIVGGQPLYARTEGLVISVMDTPGAIASAQTPVVEMVDTRNFRVVGRLQEDKGLKDVSPGQKVMFTVDAFPSRQYYGTVDSVAPSARQSDIVFSISDKRQEKEFDVSALYDVSAYPELKNGMSAKMWVYKQ